MNDEQRALRRFLDLEAEVAGNDSSEEQELELDYDGIVDEEIDSEFSSSWYLRWNSLDKEKEEEFSNFLRRIMTRATGSGTATAAYNDDIHDNAAISGIFRSPTDVDFPLWRICCRYGLEEDAVFYLLQRASSKHEIRAAFTRGSFRGWIYLEATMNEDLQKLLKLTPGVIWRPTGVAREMIEFEDWTKTLTLRDPEKDVKVGGWVRVLKGKYKGDVGYVLHLENWGGVKILLIPRLSPSSDPSLSKRKRTANPIELALFSPEFAKRLYGVEPLKKGEGVYSFDCLCFEHGLVLKTYDLCSISTHSLSIPTSILAQFQRSGHPSLSTAIYPHPSEWIFEVGEQVWLVESGRRGVIKAVGLDVAEVALSCGEGLVSASLYLLRKCIFPGDFVAITSGTLQGQTGWVDGIHGEVASLVNLRGKPDVGIAQVGDFEHCKVHINWMKVIDTPFLHASPHPVPTPDRTMRHDRVPWIGTHVFITKAGHGLRGMQAIVQDVLCGQQTMSGLRVVVQVTSFNPSYPFTKITMDYDDVVEATLGCQLYEFMQPENDLFRPNNFVPCTTLARIQPVPTVTPITHTFPWSSSGSGTPMNMPTPSSTPAWDPSSRTPAFIPDTTTYTSPHSSTEIPGHALLDLRLKDVKLRAKVNGGDFRDKEMVVSLVVTDGQPCLRCNLYHSSLYLKPEWVSPKHPSPTRDNGLLVVIKGEHCGKRVRRVHHRYVNDRAVIRVVVMMQMENGMDALTEEIFELDETDLCVAFETVEEKKLNSSLMLGLRMEARKKRAR